MAEDIQLGKTLRLLRVGAALPVLRVADVGFNFAAIIDTMKKQGGRMRRYTNLYRRLL